jgi:hypothetical protein
VRRAVNARVAGSIPARRALCFCGRRNSGDAPAFQAVQGGFDSHRPLHARVDQWQIAGTTPRRLAGSIPAARTVCRALPAGLGIPPLTRATRVRFPCTTLRCFGNVSVAQQIERLATDQEAEGASPSRDASARAHVDSSPRCSTTLAITGARGPFFPFLGRAELALGWVSKTSRQGPIPWRPATWSWPRGRRTRGGSQSAAGCKSRRPRLRSDQRLDDGFISRAVRVRIPLLRRKISGCSEVVSRCVRDAETGGSIPLTPTDVYAARA